MRRICLSLAIASFAIIISTVPVLAMGLHQGTTPPTLPNWAILLLNAGVIWLVTSGIKSLAKALPFTPELTGVATSLTAAIVGFVVVFANGLLSMIPPEYHAGVVALFGFIGTLLSAYGVQQTFKSYVLKK